MQHLKKYEYLPHTADAKFQAFGKNLEEAFHNAALALANITYESEAIKPKQRHEITIEADSVRELLILFLDEFIFLQDTEGFLLHDILSLEIQKKNKENLKSYIKLNAIVTGDHYKDYEMHGQLVKATTYNDLIIEEKIDSCMLQVVVDI